VLEYSPGRKRERVAVRCNVIVAAWMFAWWRDMNDCSVHTAVETTEYLPSGSGGGSYGLLVAETGRTRSRRGRRGTSRVDRAWGGPVPRPPPGDESGDLLASTPLSSQEVRLPRAPMFTDVRRHGWEKPDSEDVGRSRWLLVWTTAGSSSYCRARQTMTCLIEPNDSATVDRVRCVHHRR